KPSAFRSRTMTDPNPHRGRETALSYALLVLLGAATLFFLHLLTAVLGVMANVMIVVVAITMFAYFHYLWWGHSFSQETAGEREEEELRQRLEAERHRPPHDLY